MPEYIECSLEECTHARLPNGDVVECVGLFKSVPERTGMVQYTGLCARIVMGGIHSDVYFAAWPDLGITPVKEKPKPEPVTLETRLIDSLGSDGFVIHIPRVSLGMSFPGDRVRVTIEKIEEGE